MADAKARGCAVAACPESDIEQRYDALVLRKPDAFRPDAQRSALPGQRYDRLFGYDRSPQALRRTGAPDLHLLQRAADNVPFSSPRAAHIAQLQADLAEMQRRGMTVDGDYAGLYRTLVSGRRFGGAETLERRHPGMGVGGLSRLLRGAAVPAGGPSALTLGGQGRTTIREACDLSTPLRIVMAASCHFSQDAARAIAAAVRRPRDLARQPEPAP